MNCGDALSSQIGMHSVSNMEMISVTECVTDYINFSVESITPSRSVSCFLKHNKLWITIDLKELLNLKKKAFGY